MFCSKSRSLGTECDQSWRVYTRHEDTSAPPEGRAARDIDILREPPGCCDGPGFATGERPRAPAPRRRHPSHTAAPSAERRRSRCIAAHCARPVARESTYGPSPRLASSHLTPQLHLASPRIDTIRMTFCRYRVDF